MTAKNIRTHAKKRQVQALLKANRLQEAKLLLTEICNIDERDAESWFLLGVLYGKIGNPAGAESCLRRSIALIPNQVHALFNLGIALRDQGKLENSADILRQAIKIKPDYLEAYSSLGFVLLSLRRREEAIEAFHEVARRKPEFAEAHANVGAALFGHGRLEESASSLRRAIELKPEHGTFHDTLGTVLCCQGKIEEAIKQHEEAVRCQPNEPISYSNLLMTMQYRTSNDATSSISQHRLWAERYVSFKNPPANSYSNRPDPARRLRIGYVSPDFREHSVAYFLEPLLANHDSTVVEVFCYADVPHPDATTRRLQSLAHHWRPISKLPHPRVAGIIQADAIDILVDLAGHTGSNRLPVFAQKPAPIQTTYLGYPNTTGLSTMDYRLSDSHADPIGQSEAFYTETLMRLDPGFLCYQPPADAPAVKPAPCSSNNYVTFGSFNNLSKVNPEVIALWARILLALPESKMVLKYHWLSDEATRERYYSLFAKHGIARERLQVFGMAPTTAEHLAMYALMDIALDTFPYNGTTTTCEALWMGVPVITLAGRTHAGRVGVSLLSQVGLTELIAESPEQYLHKAVHLAANRDRLTRPRSELRQQIADSALCNGQAFAQRVETAYRTMWQKWCATRARA